MDHSDIWEFSTSEETEPSQASAQADSRTRLDQLPSELLLMVLEKTGDYKTVVNAMCACKKFSGLVQTNWRRMPKFKLCDAIFASYDDHTIDVQLFSNSGIIGKIRLISHEDMPNWFKYFSIFVLENDDFGTSTIFDTPAALSKCASKGFLGVDKTVTFRFATWRDVADSIVCLLERVAFNSISLVQLTRQQMHVVRTALDRSQTHALFLSAELNELWDDSISLATSCAKVAEKGMDLDFYCERKIPLAELEEKLYKPLADHEFEDVYLQMDLGRPTWQLPPLPPMKTLPNCRVLDATLECNEHWHTIVAIMEACCYGRLEKCTIYVPADRSFLSVYDEFYASLQSKFMCAEIKKYHECLCGLKFYVYPAKENRIKVWLKHNIATETLIWSIARKF